MSTIQRSSIHPISAIRAAGRKAVAVQADVSVEADVLRIFTTVDQQLGRLDALVNNAGMLEKQTRLDQMDVARWQRVLGANVIGTFLCAKQAVLRMSTKHGGKGGVIVNMSSAAARLGSPNEFIDYAAAKGAVDSMTLGLAKEVATEGIRVNAIRPGLIYTDIHASAGEPGRVDRAKAGVPMQRGGTADEVAEAKSECQTYCRAMLWIVPAKVQGDWTANGGRISLNQAYQNVSGSMNVNGTQTPISNGKLNGDNFTFE